MIFQKIVEIKFLRRDSKQKIVCEKFSVGFVGDEIFEKNLKFSQKLPEAGWS